MCNRCSKQMDVYHFFMYNLISDKRAASLVGALAVGQFGGQQSDFLRHIDVLRRLALFCTSSGHTFSYTNVAISYRL